MSPYLFILCVDILSGMIHKADVSKGLHGIQVSRKAPTISHLFFADDNLLFSRANEEELGRILQILQKYQQASRKVVNIEKSEVYFNINMNEVSRELIRQKLGFKAGGVILDI